MKNYITQYKVIFCLSWIVLYLIFPSWISKHLIFQEHGFPNIPYPAARSLVILGFALYFSISAYLLNRYFNTLAVDRPFIVKIEDLFAHIKNNLGLVVVSCLSVALHIFSSPSVIVLNEVRALEQTFWMYDVIDRYWHTVFDFPVQYFFWVLLIVIMLIIKQKKIAFFVSERLKDFFQHKSSTAIKLFSILSLFGIFTVYSYLFPYYTFNESLQLVRYPPVSRVIYISTYLAFGASYIGPRAVQFIFYILSAIYLYRTILLFNEKETALLGSTIYLFSPIIFSYATIASLESGAVFLIVLTSFYFLRFIKSEDNRDLILATYFIGIGFLYKRGLLIMFFVCFAYLAYDRIKRRDFHSFIHFKILLFSLVPILPWMKIGPNVPSIWSNLMSFDGLSIVSQMVHSQISSTLFFLFLVAFIGILVARRSESSLFFGLLFCAYYLLFTIMRFGEWNHRYIMALYPAIAVYLAQFLTSITQIIRWKHAFKAVFVVLTVYLIGICLIPRTSSSLISYKYKDFETQLFPIDKATDWIRNKTEYKDKILVLYMIPYKLYVNRIYTERDKFNQEKFIFRDLGTNAKDIMFPIQNLKTFCKRESISYVMFPFGPKNNFPEAESLKEKWEMRKYLHENMDDYFIRVAKFSIEDNNIYIYKIAE